MPSTPSTAAAAIDPQPRPLRADARRNRERLLAVAEAAFASVGTEASLDDIARRAGVGIGTLYRHFPTRDDLVEALIEGEVDQLLAEGERLGEAEDPFAALQEWLQALVHHATRFRGLAQSLVEAECGENRLSTSCRAKTAATAILVDRARDGGQLRFDATVDDVLALVSAIAWVSEQGPHNDADRLLGIALDGLRS